MVYAFGVRTARTPREDRHGPPFASLFIHRLHSPPISPEGELNRRQNHLHPDIRFLYEEPSPLKNTKWGRRLREARQRPSMAGRRPAAQLCCSGRRLPTQCRSKKSALYLSTERAREEKKYRPRNASTARLRMNTPWRPSTRLERTRRPRNTAQDEHRPEAGRRSNCPKKVRGRTSRSLKSDPLHRGRVLFDVFAKPLSRA